MKIHIKKIKAGHEGAQCIAVTCGSESTIEINRLGIHDPDHPGDIGIIPRPSLSQKRVKYLLGKAPKNRLVTVALDALKAGTADFYGDDFSVSVVAQALEAKRKRETAHYPIYRGRE